MYKHFYKFLQVSKSAITIHPISIESTLFFFLLLQSFLGVNECTNCFSTSERNCRNKFENQYSLQSSNREKWCRIEYTIIKVPIVMSIGYPGKFSERQCKIQLSRDSQAKPKVLEGSCCWLSESLKSKISYTGIIISLSRFELHGGWKV